MLEGQVDKSIICLMVQPAIKKLKEQPMVTNLLKLNTSSEASGREQQESDAGTESLFETEQQERAKIFEMTEESGGTKSETVEKSDTPSPPPPGMDKPHLQADLRCLKIDACVFPTTPTSPKQRPKCLELRNFAFLEGLDMEVFQSTEADFPRPETPDLNLLY